MNTNTVVASEHARRHTRPFSRALCYAALLAAVVLTPLGYAHAQGAASRSAGAPDTVAISELARWLSSDALRGRGPFTAENEAAARRLARELQLLGAKPLHGDSILTPFTVPEDPSYVHYNVLAVLPARSGSAAAPMVGITSHFDHLGVGVPDSTGDSIYNGFLDAALPTAMVIDVARRFAAEPGDRPLAVMLFNLEERGLLGARAFVSSFPEGALAERFTVVVGVDAGSPAGEAVEWQLMGGLPEHETALVADSLARVRGWTTHSTPPRRISDVFSFSERGVPILFPIPGRVWRGYTESERDAAMARFDHYHRPGDQWRSDFPWTGTAAFADWLFDIVALAAGHRPK